MSNLRNHERSHIYDLGRYKFNETEDVDLINYGRMGYESFQSELNPSKQGITSNIKLSRHSSVPQVYQDELYNTSIVYVKPYSSPFESCKGLFAGLKKTIEQIHERLRKFGGAEDFSLDFRKFLVTEYAIIRTIDQKVHLYFPVEMSQVVTLNDEQFDVCINLDNPTSLPLRNQSNGCQGSHFGFTLIKRSNGERTRGHVLMTTFVGFPSRNMKTKAAIMKQIRERPDALNLVSATELCKAAVRDKPFLFHITTELAIKKTTNMNDLHLSDRIKRLPNELKLCHNTFGEPLFRLPDLDDKNISGYLKKFCNTIKPKQKLP
jgi:hypothetical protein